MTFNDRRRTIGLVQHKCAIIAPPRLLKMPAEYTDITLLLRRWRGGDRHAEGQLFEVVLPELRVIANRCMSRERRDHTLQATELIGQVYARLVKAGLIRRPKGRPET